MSYAHDAKINPGYETQQTVTAVTTASDAPAFTGLDPKRPFFTRMVDSFGRAPETDTWRRDQHGQILRDANGDPEKQLPDEALKRNLKGRHLQMIAIGGSIGTGLFVGSGGSFTAGGPASVLIAFLIIGLMLFAVVHALGELAVMYPVQGSFAVFGTRFIDPAWGFAMGWNYALQWLIVLPLELSAAAIVINYWDTGVHVGIWITIFFLIIVAINLCGVKGYGEAEFYFSSIKVIAVVGFIIAAICIDVGASPSGIYFGTKTYSNPGAFNNGFPGLCAVFVNAAFSFAGTELIGLAAAETENPRKILPRATKQVFWRILLFYVISLLLVGFIVPYDHPDLLNGSSKAASSPFVIAIKLGGIKVLPDLFNGVILVAILSVGNSSTYGSSRTIAALAHIGQAPKIFGYIDRKGRPMAALALALVFGLLAYINLAATGPTIFNWLLAISGLSSFFTWGSICLCHVRFRKGWKVQGHTLAEIPFTSACGVIGSWIGFVINFLCLVAQFYVAVFPVGSGTTASAYDFFQLYLAVPVIIGFYVVYKALNWRTSKFVRSSTMDVLSGRRQVDIDAMEADAAEKAALPSWKRFYVWLC